MRQKNAKKIRQEMRAAAPDMLVMFHTYFVKPKPRWVPKWLWSFGLNRFVYIPK